MNREEFFRMLREKGPMFTVGLVAGVLLLTVWTYRKNIVAGFSTILNKKKEP